MFIHSLNLIQNGGFAEFMYTCKKKESTLNKTDQKCENNIAVR